MTTLVEWLATREPPPPDALLRRLSEALGSDVERDAGEATELCLAAGERLLQTVLREDEACRDYALDLLAADALVTYAFEAASADASSLPERAARAMTRIAAPGVSMPVNASAARA